MSEFKWTADDVERLILASKSLSASSKRRQSSFDNAELLLNKPQFINSLILEIISQQQDDDKMSERWKKIIGELRWLLSRSRVYNFNSNSQTEASLYFSSTNTPSRSDSGRNRKISSNAMDDMVKWFPDMTINEVRKHVNSATFLVESLPPKNNRDVELDKYNRVTKWYAFNNRNEIMKLSPVDDQTRGSELKSLLPELETHKRYGLKFDGMAEKNMYGIAESSGLILRDKTSTVVLTLTFLVGELDNNSSDAAKKKRTQSSSGGAVAGAKEEEFILSDYRYSSSSLRREKTSKKHMRALSIETIEGEEEDTFELYLYGAESGGGRRKIGTGLKTSWFYTVQIKWGAEVSRSEGTVHCLDSFYAICENDTCLTKKSFQCPPLKDIARSALYIGGLNAAKTDTGIVKSNCFSGIVSNIEILITNNARIPESLLNFIITNQIITNDIVSTNTSSKFIKNDVFLS